MYAVIAYSGLQYKITPGMQIDVNRMDAKVGTKHEIEKVLLYHDDKDYKIGNPYVSGIKVSAKILEHFRGDKVIIFKKKRRKSYDKKQGHRQDYTRLLIESIGTFKMEEKKPAKAAPKKAAEAKVVKKETKVTKKKEVKKAASKKVAKGGVVSKPRKVAATKTAPKKETKKTTKK